MDIKSAPCSYHAQGYLDCEKMFHGVKEGYKSFDERKAIWDRTFTYTPEFGASRGQWGTGFEYVCPNNGMITEFRARAGRVVDGIHVVCSNGDTTLRGSPWYGGFGGNFIGPIKSKEGFSAIINRSDRVIDQLALVDTNNVVYPVGGGNGGSPRASKCPTGSVIVGIRGSYTNVLEKLGAICVNKDAIMDSRYE